jgi:hypothetical protein
MSDTDILTRFQPGDVLVIHPQDGDDVEATACAGLECVFVRYVQYTGHACVTLMGKARPM